MKHPTTWREVARLVLSGLASKFSESHLKAIQIGLEDSDHPECKKALEVIRKMGEK